jgi:D-glycero-D-manno-heptose 1,7-bisphosphate phosphatase
MHPAIFLDRDGVIIENRDQYVRSWDDVHFIPGALHAMGRIAHCACKVVIVTNQSAVGRGVISRGVAEELNARIQEEIERAGGRVDGIFMCPHAPDDGCPCRKPLPGLLLEAAQVLQIDLSQSFMIGDAVSDLQAGQAAGVKQAILLRTGRGALQEPLAAQADLAPYTVCDSLAEALTCLGFS